MKQPEIKVTSTSGVDFGYRKIVSMNWDREVRLWVVNVDFMGTGDSTGYLAFYNYTGEFLSANENLRGEITFN